MQICSECEKPAKLEYRNRFSLETWQGIDELKRLGWKFGTSDILAVVEGKGGTVEDFEKVLIIETIYNRLNNVKQA